MSRLELVATYAPIPEEKRAEFKQQARAVIEASRSEPGLLSFDVYFTADDSRCVFREVYVDSPAVMAHMANAGELIGSLVELSDGMHLDVFGKPSEELLAGGGPADYFIYSRVEG